MQKLREPRRARYIGENPPTLSRSSLKSPSPPLRLGALVLRFRSGSMLNNLSIPQLSRRSSGDLRRLLRLLLRGRRNEPGPRLDLRSQVHPVRHAHGGHCQLKVIMRTQARRTRRLPNCFSILLHKHQRPSPCAFPPVPRSRRFSPRLIATKAS